MQNSLAADKKMSHCPGCNKPVMNNGQFIGPAQFRIRCPWCQENLLVTVQTKITVEAIASHPDHATTEIRTEPIVNTETTVSKASEAQSSINEPVAPPFKVSLGKGMKLVGYVYPDNQSSS
jgi:hypothetical protein